MAVALGAVLVGSVAKVNAENKGRGDDFRSVGSTLEVHINHGGKVLVRGAQVTAIDGSTISATTMFGGYTMIWTVKTGADTQFIRKHNGASSIAEISVGDVISFAGMFDTTASTPTVNSNIIKDWSIQKIDQVLSGKVKTVNAGAQSFVLATERKGDVTVQTNASTIITSGTTTANFSAITVGAKIKATGVWNSVTNVLTASKVRVQGTED